jgi:RNA polymerase sigma-70 factor (ECF subfamily)
VTANPIPAGLEEAFLTHREALVRFLRARGAGDSAEDLVQDVWLKIAGSRSGPVASPLAYLYRAADLLMIDRFRATRQSSSRDHAWTEVYAGDPPGVSAEPSAERRIAAAQEVQGVLAILDRLGPRPATIFRRHRIDGVAQKALAQELGVSLSTIEGDLRVAYQAIAEWKEKSQRGLAR